MELLHALHFQNSAKSNGFCQTAIHMYYPLISLAECVGENNKHCSALIFLLELGVLHLGTFVI